MPRTTRCSVLPSLPLPSTASRKPEVCVPSETRCCRSGDSSTTVWLYSHHLSQITPLRHRRRAHRTCGNRRPFRGVRGNAELVIHLESSGKKDKSASQLSLYFAAQPPALPLYLKGRTPNEVVWECILSIFLICVPKSRFVFLTSALSATRRATAPKTNLRSKPF